MRESLAARRTSSREMLAAVFLAALLAASIQACSSSEPLAPVVDAASEVDGSGTDASDAGLDGGASIDASSGADAGVDADALDGEPAPPDGASPPADGAPPSTDGAAEGGTGGGDVGEAGVPASCVTDTDCVAAGACPKDATMGCACATTPSGFRCVPSCIAASDCSDPSQNCSAAGVCVPAGGGGPGDGGPPPDGEGLDGAGPADGGAD